MKDRGNAGDGEWTFGAFNDDGRFTKWVDTYMLYTLPKATALPSI